MNKYDIIIAIDPDVDKSGVALLKVSTRELQLDNFDFIDTLEYLEWANNVQKQYGSKILVVIECGFKNKSNWH
jgi:hypothetical protein